MSKGIVRDIKKHLRIFRSSTTSLNHQFNVILHFSKMYLILEKKYRKRSIKNIDDDASNSKLTAAVQQLSSQGEHVVTLNRLRADRYNAAATLARKNNTNASECRS